MGRARTTRTWRWRRRRCQRGCPVELRAEAFNVFNHGQFFGPAAVNGNISSTNFGQVQTRHRLG